MKRHSERRDSILSAASNEFAAVGYEQATLETIGQSVGLSKGSLYYYVPGKEALLVLLLERVIDQIETAAIARTPVDATPIERLKAFLQAHIEVTTASPDGHVLAKNYETLMRLERASDLRKRHEQTLAAILMSGVTDGTFRDLQPNPVTKMLFAAVNSIPLWFDGTGELTLDDLVDTSLQLMLTGILRTKAT